MKVIDKARDHLREKLNQCKPEQIEMFNLMYKSIDEIPLEKMEWAEGQIDRTLEINKKEK